MVRQQGILSRSRFEVEASVEHNVTDFNPDTEDFELRTVFSIDMKVDLNPDDETTAQVFVDLCRQTAQTLFTQAAMLAASTGSKVTPVVGLHTLNSQEGQKDLDVFSGETKPG